MTAFRNGLAALAATVLILLLGHALAPALAAYMPGQAAVAGALGVVGCFVTMFYKLIDTALAALGWGARTAPVSSRWVSVLGGASIIGLVSGAFVVVVTALVEQALPLLKASPGTAVTVASPLAHLPLLKTIAELFVALLIGTSIGRRHGRPSLIVVVGFALLAWAAMLTIDSLAGLRSMPAMHAALRELIHTPSLAIVKAAELPMLGGLLFVALLGAWLGGGGRSKNRDRRPLTLGGEGSTDL